MAKKYTMDQFDGLVKVRQHLKKQEWRQACLDVRSAKAKGARLSKFRVRLSNDKRQAFHEPVETNRLLREIWGIKDKLFPRKWYGLRVTVQPDGTCETEFNYDAECVSDPQFFDD